MNLTSKQRAYLGSEASTMNAIFQIGKASLTPELINGLDEALEKRELIKISVLKNCADDPREIAEIIAERTHSVVVKVIGKKIILFRQAKKNSKYELPVNKFQNTIKDSDHESFIRQENRYFRRLL